MAKVKIVSNANVSSWRDENYKSRKVQKVTTRALAESTDKVIAIGASTGGTEAIRHILREMPGDAPGIVIVQHMPPGFTKMFAERLNTQCDLLMKEAESGDRILQGQALIAPGNFHMSVIRSGGTYRVNCKEGEKVCGHRPSVEVLFQSVAKYAGSNAIGVMLTGMGHDGADGMVAMKTAGAPTLAQDEKTSVVFGMPKVAYERGGTDKLVPLYSIANEVINTLVEKN